MYEGRSINKLQNGAIPSVLKIGEIRNIRFVGNLILNIHTTFLGDDVIIVTSSDNRTQSICVLFSPWKMNVYNTYIWVGEWRCKMHGGWKFSRGLFLHPNSPSTRLLVQHCPGCVGEVLWLKQED